MSVVDENATDSAAPNADHADDKKKKRSRRVTDDMHASGRGGANKTKARTTRPKGKSKAKGKAASTAASTVNNIIADAVAKARSNVEGMHPHLCVSDTTSSLSCRMNHLVWEIMLHRLTPAADLTLDWRLHMIRMRAMHCTNRT